MVFFEIGIGAASFIGGWAIREILFKRNPGISQLITAAQRKDMLVFLETPTGIFIRRIIKKYHQIGVTDNKEIVIIPETSMKQCSSLGIRVGFGDLHRAIAVPKEVIKAKDEMKSYGFSDDEIAWFFKEIHDVKSGNALQALFENRKKELKYTLNSAAKNAEGELENIKEAVVGTVSMYQVYQTLPFAVKDFILSGMNQTTYTSELRNLVAQRELEKIGGRNWVALAIAIAIVLAIIGIFGPDVIRAINAGTASQAIPPLPNPLAGRI